MARRDTVETTLAPLADLPIPSSRYVRLGAGDKSVDRNCEYPYPLSTVLSDGLAVEKICFVVPLALERWAARASARRSMNRNAVFTATIAVPERTRREKRRRTPGAITYGLLYVIAGETATTSRSHR